MNNIDICITLKATRSLKVKVLMFANLSGVTFATSDVLHRSAGLPNGSTCKLYMLGSRSSRPSSTVRSTLNGTSDLLTQWQCIVSAW